MRGTRWNLCFALIAVMTFIFSSVVVSYLGRYEKLLAEEREIFEEIEVEKDKGRKLNEELEFNQSDAFVEKIARERLNLVMPDEILFYNDEK